MRLPSRIQLFTEYASKREPSEVDKTAADITPLLKLEKDKGPVLVKHTKNQR